MFIGLMHKSVKLLITNCEPEIDAVDSDSIHLTELKSFLQTVTMRTIIKGFPHTMTL